MDKVDRTGSSVRLVDQTVRGSVQVPRWSGGNRMGETCRHDENRWINLHVAKHGMCFAQFGLGLREGSRRGILVIVPNIALVT